VHYRKIKKLLSLALITFALLLPFWEDSRVQEEAKVSGSVTHAGVGFHASTQPTFILYLIPPTYLTKKVGAM